MDESEGPTETRSSGGGIVKITGAVGCTCRIRRYTRMGSQFRLLKHYDKSHTYRTTEDRNGRETSVGTGEMEGSLS